MVEILLNNNLIELSDDKDISYTIQVNDIADVSSRQASYTSSFKFPKTPQNTKVVNGLSLVGDTSRIPYEKIKASYKDNGFDVIPFGWGVIKNTEKDYNLCIYNGIIDFFSAIENKTLGNDLDLSEINHEKTVATVINSFTQGFPYRYLVGDYNGKTHFDIDNKILIDYLPPSASVDYLWNKIFTTFGFTYSGTIFNDIRFKDLWLTYPKGVAQGLLSTTLILESNNFSYLSTTVNPLSTLINNNDLSYSNGFFTCNFNLSLIINIRGNQEFTLMSTGSPSPYYIIITINNVQVYASPITRVSYDFTINLTVSQNDQFEIFTSRNDIIYGSFTYLNIKKYNTLQSFSEELKEFKITDFVKEIVNAFALTMFTDQENKSITFLTIKERVQTSEFLNWSDKYIERTNETYIFDNYAQKNNFKFQYNDKEDAHNDGSIIIENVNIKDSLDVWKSITYSPLKETNNDFLIGSTILPPIKIFKQYEKEIKEANIGSLEIKYKPLSKRFYFQRSEQKTDTATFGSILLSNQQTVTNGLIQIANFNQLDMNSVIGFNYLPMQTILNDSRLHTIKLALNVIDIMILDFKKIYYFEQESMYYLLNKINFKNGTFSNAEFIRIKL